MFAFPLCCASKFKELVIEVAFKVGHGGAKMGKPEFAVQKAVRFQSKACEQNTWFRQTPVSTVLGDQPRAPFNLVCASQGKTTLIVITGDVSGFKFLVVSNGSLSQFMRSQPKLECKTSTFLPLM